MTRDALLSDAAAVRQEVARYFTTLPLAELFQRREGAWAPVDDLRHLTLSVDATTRGFTMPPDVLLSRFGTPAGPSRSRREVGALAMGGLRAGGKATEAITPRPVPAADRTEAFRQSAVMAWEASARSFEAAVATWSEASLDRCRLPHPFLGLFTLREWCHFHVLHARHHIGVAERRLGRKVDPTS